MFAAYAGAIGAMAWMGLMTLMLSGLSGRRKMAAGLVAGAIPAADYADPTYRWHRAHVNAVEAAGSFALVTVAAILAGANPFWVNLFATIFILARVVMMLLHIRGGKANMGARSMLYALGVAMCVLLGVFALVAALGGSA
jgi:uncharacterized MAPEG superfamily protein